LDNLTRLRGWFYVLVLPLLVVGVLTVTLRRAGGEKEQLRARQELEARERAASQTANAVTVDLQRKNLARWRALLEQCVQVTRNGTEQAGRIWHDRVTVLAVTGARCPYHHCDGVEQLLPLVDTYAHERVDALRVFSRQGRVQAQERESASGSDVATLAEVVVPACAGVTQWADPEFIIVGRDGSVADGGSHEQALSGSGKPYSLDEAVRRVALLTQ
jgi:hypothetical protein